MGANYAETQGGKILGMGGVDSGASKNGGLDIPGVGFYYTFIS